MPFPDPKSIHAWNWLVDRYGASDRFPAAVLEFIAMCRDPRTATNVSCRCASDLELRLGLMQALYRRGLQPTVALRWGQR